MRGCTITLGVLGAIAAFVVWLVNRTDTAQFDSTQDAVGAWLGWLLLIAFAVTVLWFFLKRL